MDLGRSLRETTSMLHPSCLASTSNSVSGTSSWTGTAQPPGKEKTTSGRAWRRRSSAESRSAGFRKTASFILASWRSSQEMLQSVEQQIESGATDVQESRVGLGFRHGAAADGRQEDLGAAAQDAAEDSIAVGRIEDDDHRDAFRECGCFCPPDGPAGELLMRALGETEFKEIAAQGKKA